MTQPGRSCTVLSTTGQGRCEMAASRRRLVLAAGVAAGLLLGGTACGTAQVAGAGPPRAASSGASGSAGPSAVHPGRSASISSPQSEAGATAEAPAGPVPAGFAATSVTWVSPDEAFVLGTAPCAHAPCTVIARTLDRGASWTGVPAPAVPIGAPGQPGAVWGIRFATPEHGFVFGDGLWETTDGGGRWARAVTPRGLVLSLAIVPGQVLAIIVPCIPEGGCQHPGTLARRAL